MKYKKKKYFKQNLDLKKFTANIDFFLVFQLKVVNVSSLVSLKKALSKHDLKFKSYSTNLFKKNHVFNSKSKVIENLYTGKILIVYFKKKLPLSNLGDLKLEKLISTFENCSFLILLHVFFAKSFFAPGKFKKLLSLCLINSKLELTQLILIKYINFLKLFNNQIVK